MKFRVHIETDEDGVFVAECPTLPGCISQGPTRQEAVVNIKDAIAGYLTSLEKHGEAVPLPMNRLHFPIRGRRTSATDEDDLKDAIAALSPSSSSFVRRWRRTAHRPMCRDARSAVHGLNSCRFFGKLSYP